MSAFDVAVVGTGVAALAAANRLHSAGKAVLLLNPDRDFFGEDSELPLDPFFPLPPGQASRKRLLASSQEQALQALSPDFPGALESWFADGRARGAAGFHDPLAPHVRSRSRLWLTRRRSKDWEALERLYLEASEAGLNPQLIDGGSAVARLPGFSARQAQRIFDEGSEGGLRGILVPRLSDVDVSRYRNGLLEYVRERLGPESILSGVSRIELIPEGVRFHQGRTPSTARIGDSTKVFWTPRMSPWVLGQAKRSGARPLLPKGVRLWEEWVLVSRERLDPGVVGAFSGMAVWAEIEGAPSAASGSRSDQDRLVVLMPGALVAAENFPQSGPSSAWGSNWASSESFTELMRLCGELLMWDKFSIRSMRPRAIFEWSGDSPGARTWTMPSGGPEVTVIGGADGPLADVLRVARLACGEPA